MDKEKLKQILTEHKKNFLQFEGIYPRETAENRALIQCKEVIVITGVRRSGKSTLMKLFAKFLLDEGISKDNLFFVNFDDERLIDFKISDFEELYEAFLELNFPVGKVYYFLDEIQNVNSWEKWVSRMYESGNVKFFITGSNSSILKSDYSSLLTGRNRQITNYPFSFREYLMAYGINPENIDFYDSQQVAEVKRKSYSYLESGGFPEIIKNNDIALLEQYFKDIVFRDIILKNKLKNMMEIRELALILSSESGNIQSLQRLQNAVGIKSPNSIKSYLEFFSDCFLFIPLGLYSFSVKKQVYNPKKVYIVDTGMAKSVSFKFSENEGRYNENLVFIELLRRNEDIYYWKSEKNLEVDFLLRHWTKVTKAIQVSLSLSEEKTSQREISALVAAHVELGIDDLLILTKDEEFEITQKNLKIKVLPIWKFLINK